MRGVHVRQEVSEPVDQEHLPQHGPAHPPRTGARQAIRVPDGGAQALERHPEGAVRRDGGEEIPGVERPADAGRPGPVVRRVGERDRAGPRRVDTEAEQPVVGSHEGVAVGEDGEGAAGAADARIDHGEVDGAAGKEPVRGLEGESAAQDVLRRDGVGQVDETGRGIDAEDHALHDSDVRILETEIGEERDDAAGPRLTSWPRRPPKSSRVSHARRDAETPPV